MSDATVDDLESMARAAALHVAGDEVIDAVEVAEGEDWTGQPAYYFSFRVDQARATQRTGLLRSRLGQQLRDALLARGDAHYPFIRMLSKGDWDRRGIARP